MWEIETILNGRLFQLKASGNSQIFKSLLKATRTYGLQDDDTPKGRYSKREGLSSASHEMNNNNHETIEQITV